MSTGGDQNSFIHTLTSGASPTPSASFFAPPLRREGLVPHNYNNIERNEIIPSNTLRPAVPPIILFPGANPTANPPANDHPPGSDEYQDSDDEDTIVVDVPEPEFANTRMTEDEKIDAIKKWALASSHLGPKYVVLESNRRGVTSGMDKHLKAHGITKNSHFARIHGYSDTIGGGDYTELDGWSVRRDKLRYDLDINCVSISFTLDMWTNPNRKPIFAIIGH
ncbi:hypothetical protein BKA64DRAFT_760133 [Cadophora sp. MPI-SDFR-AT-0126]|nr:hypothetical protein BKA64DRAFT_760133 [Leotiomycetes sp. MPI-SDFR-AT-0126]